jgi:hypothetical protein
LICWDLDVLFVVEAVVIPFDPVFEAGAFMGFYYTVVVDPLVVVNPEYGAEGEDVFVVLFPVLFGVEFVDLVPCGPFCLAVCVVY